MIAKYRFFPYWCKYAEQKQEKNHLIYRQSAEEPHICHMTLTHGLKQNFTPEIELHLLNIKLKTSTFELQDKLSTLEKCTIWTGKENGQLFSHVLKSC